MTAIKLYPVIQRLKLSRASENYIQAIQDCDMQNTWADYDITTHLRAAHFLAQILHETGGFNVLRENMNYSASRLMQIFGVNKHSAAITTSESKRLAGKPKEIAIRVYGTGNPKKARELGNVRPDDGWLCRGGGSMQTTGGNAYKEWGEKLGIPLYENTDLIADPRYCIMTALFEWKASRCNAMADKNNIRGITKVINGGYNGYDDRVAWFNKVWKILQTTTPALLENGTTSAWQAAKVDTQTVQLQENLNELGANPQLNTDGRFGPATEKAVRAFQKANNLRVDGIPGAATLEVIKLRLNAFETTPPSASSEAPTALPEKSGGVLAGAGLLGSEVLDKVNDAKDLVGDNEYLSIALGILTIAGIALVVYGFWRKHRYDNRTVVE